MGAELTWHPIYTVPKGTPLLAHYRNECGESRIIKAQYVEPRTMESFGYAIEFGEYDEDRGAYYVPGGWYELIENWDEFSMIAIDCRLDHWMPMPKPPEVPE